MEISLEATTEEKSLSMMVKTHLIKLASGLEHSFEDDGMDTMVSLWTHLTD